MGYETEILLEGLVFGEGPRWHEKKLWFSDMHAHQVMTVDLDGKVETVVEVPAQPSGLGWLPVNWRRTTATIWRLTSGAEPTWATSDLT